MARLSIASREPRTHFNFHLDPSMGQLVTSGALMSCSFGMSPGALTVLPIRRTLCGSPAATIMDFTPFLNIPTFGACQSLSNPSVSAATSAASGVLTPMPCVPVTASPWTPGSPTVMIGSVPALNNSSTCTCSWGGVITISFAGQVTTTVA